MVTFIASHPRSSICRRFGRGTQRIVAKRRPSFERWQENRTEGRVPRALSSNRSTIYCKSWIRKNLQNQTVQGLGGANYRQNDYLGWSLLFNIYRISPKKNGPTALKFRFPTAQVLQLPSNGEVTSPIGARALIMNCLHESRRLRFFLIIHLVNLFR